MSSMVSPLSFMFSWLLLLVSSVAMAVPLGVPPAATTPLMLQIAPEECLYFINWSGRGEADSNSSNATERLLAEPEIQRFGAEVLQTLRNTMAQFAGQSPSPEAKVIAEIVPVLVEKSLRGPGSLYLGKAELGPTGLVVDAGIVLAVGDQGPAMTVMLNRFVQEVLQRDTKEVVIQGKPFRSLELGGGVPIITWGLYQQNLVIGLGKGSVEGILGRANTPQPNWLSNVLQRWPLDRRSTVAYADMDKLLALLVSMVPDGSGEKAAQLLGVKNVKTYLSVSGLAEDQYVGYSAMVVDGQLQGALGLLDAPSLTKADMTTVPADVQAAFLLKMDVLEAYQWAENALEILDPQGHQQWLKSLKQLEEMVGAKLREDLLDSLGSTWTIYTSPDTGGWITGWLLAVDVKDRARLLSLQENLLKKLSEAFPRGGRRRSSFAVNKSTFLGQDIVVVGTDILPLSLAVTDGQLLVSAYPQAIKAHLKWRERSLRQQPPASKSLATSPRIAPLVSNDQGPQLVQYLDVVEAVRMAYPALQIGARFACGELRSDGFPVTIASLPSLESILPHLQPGTMSVHRVEDGIEFRSSKTIPSNIFSVSAPIAVASLLPAVSAARESARRVASSNNLKQIGLAMHTFHDTYNGFPAAHSADKNGKPLLSWRVHVLPFVEGEALYRQFKLDEPWDSPHNKKLISQMPAIYKSPGSVNGPGKTNYQAIRVAQSVIKLPPRATWGKKVPVGTMMREITDGTSNTAMVVESNDTKSVIWTKPDDLLPDTKDPAKGMRGLRRNGFSVLISDGSVRFLSDRVDARVLKAIFTRNGGEAFGVNQLR